MSPRIRKMILTMQTVISHLVLSNAENTDHVLTTSIAPRSIDFATIRESVISGSNPPDYQEQLPD